MTIRTDGAPRLTTSGQLFLGAVITIGLVVVMTSVYELHVQPVSYQWYLLAALTLISGSATIQLPSVPASISVSETFVFASVLLFGPAAGTVTVALDGLVISFWMAKRRPEWYRALFNMAAPAIAIWVAANFLFTAANLRPLVQQPLSVNALIIPLLVFAALYFTLNSWLIAWAVAFETGTPPYKVWRENFLWLSLNYFSGASVALLLVVYTRDVDLRFIGVIVPLLLVLYFTYKNSMARVEDANTHLQQLNRLYLSTIETLAMAIDAKDQTTHGHIRRVQAMAVGLAHRVGVMDENLIKAIEAAALLHDTGKLAVPEYILNKPGKLSAAEFEQMKRHATIGADILTAVDFPFPVVPIVRHHHENWDGTGYPSRLKGTDIPIGARILSVVDCFDALTSDRPYRPRLKDEEAIGILYERRGTMYDPLVVDTFARVHKEIAPEQPPSDQTRRALAEITSSSQLVSSDAAPSSESAATVDDMLTLHQLARALAGQATLSDTADVIARHLRRLTPSSLAIFYVHDPNTDELEAKHAVGDGAPSVRGLRIALGQRLSGWVAVNRRSMLNSDPVLDLDELARSLAPPLKSCLSTPLLLDEELVGVLTLYSPSQNAFSDDHRRIVEMVSNQVARSLRRASEFETSSRDDVLSTLPNLEQLQQFVDATIAAPIAKGTRLTLVTVDVIGLTQIRASHGRGADDVLRHVVRNIRLCLRPTDTLFGHGADELVVVLNDADPETAASISQRIRDSIRNTAVLTRASVSIKVDVTVTVLPYFEYSGTLRDLILTIQGQRRPTGTPTGSAIH